MKIKKFHNILRLRLTAAVLVACLLAFPIVHPPHNDVNHPDNHVCTTCHLVFQSGQDTASFLSPAISPKIESSIEYNDEVRYQAFLYRLPLSRAPPSA